MHENENIEPLVSDDYIARLVDKSESWVRLERHRRRHGLAHVLTVDWIKVGGKPRYRRKDIDEWFSQVTASGELVQVEELVW